MGEGLAIVPGLGGRPGGSASKALTASEKEAVSKIFTSHITHVCCIQYIFYSSQF
jgi:hypothetical protein